MLLTFGTTTSQLSSGKGDLFAAPAMGYFLGIINALLSGAFPTLCPAVAHVLGFAVAAGSVVTSVRRSLPAARILHPTQGERYCGVALLDQAWFNRFARASLGCRLVG